MSILTTARSAVRHRGKTVTDLKKEIATLTCLVMKRTTQRDTAVAAVNKRDKAMAKAVERIADLEEQLKTQAGKVVRRDAELRRLAACLKETQQQLANTRPRITKVAAMDRPYVAAVPIPYPVPVGRCTANDETQELALLELPLKEVS